MIAFLLWSSGLQQHTAQSTTCLSTSQKKVWSTVFILSEEPFYAVMICTFTVMETSNLKSKILNHTLMLKTISTLDTNRFAWLLDCIILFMIDRIFEGFILRVFQLYGHAVCSSDRSTYITVVCKTS
jgi:hypothetical protein